MKGGREKGSSRSARIAAILDGVCGLLGVALIIDAARAFFTPDAAILNTLVRGPGGFPIPAVGGLLLGAAFLSRHRIAALVLIGAGVLALINIAEFYLMRARGLPAAAVPFSWVTLGLIAAGIARTFVSSPKASWRWSAGGAAVAAPILVLLHLFTFGTTDYARPAQAIVVFGAGVGKDGAPSLALEDRVRHAIRLWESGKAPVLVLSGGPDEVPVMKRLALQAGVPERALELDPKGLDTYATLANLRHRDVVAVSHYYHLARIKMTARRLGLECATSPCVMSRRLAKEVYYVARECAAIGTYYLFRG